MKISSSSRTSFYWQLTLWLGVFLTLAGLSAGFIGGQWSSPIVLVILGTGALILAVGVMVRAAQPRIVTGKQIGRAHV